MIMASTKTNPSKEWRHEPIITNNEGNTVAMILA